MKRVLVLLSIFLCSNHSLNGYYGYRGWSNWSESRNSYYDIYRDDHLTINTTFNRDQSTYYDQSSYNNSRILWRSDNPSFDCEIGISCQQTTDNQAAYYNYTYNQEEQKQCSPPIKQDAQTRIKHEAIISTAQRVIPKEFFQQSYLNQTSFYSFTGTTKPQISLHENMVEFLTDNHKYLVTTPNQDNGIRPMLSDIAQKSFCDAHTLNTYTQLTSYAQKTFTICKRIVSIVTQIGVKTPLYTAAGVVDAIRHPVAYAKECISNFLYTFNTMHTVVSTIIEFDSIVKWQHYRHEYQEYLDVHLVNLEMNINGIDLKRFIDTCTHLTANDIIACLDAVEERTDDFCKTLGLLGRDLLLAYGSSVATNNVAFCVKKGQLPEAHLPTSYKYTLKEWKNRLLSYKESATTASTSHPTIVPTTKANVPAVPHPAEQSAQHLSPEMVALKKSLQESGKKLQTANLALETEKVIAPPAQMTPAQPSVSPTTHTITPAVVDTPYHSPAIQIDSIKKGIDEVVKLSEAGTATVHAPTTAQTAMTPQYNLLNASDIPQIIKNESKLITSGEQKILLKRITVEPKNTEYTMHIFPPSLDRHTLESLRTCTVLHEGVQKPFDIFHILGCEYTIKVNNTTGTATSKISGLHYNFPEAQDVFRGIEFTNVQHHPTGVIAAKISYGNGTAKKQKTFFPQNYSADIIHHNIDSLLKEKRTMKINKPGQSLTLAGKTPDHVHLKICFNSTESKVISVYPNQDIKFE